MSNANTLTDDLLGHNHTIPKEVTNQDLYVILVLMNRRVGELQAKVDEQGNELADMREIWQNAGGVLKFVKIMGALSVALIAIAGVVKIAKDWINS